MLHWPTRPYFCVGFWDRAEQEGYIYYVMEAFDQPWKRVTEGAVGAYWGVYDAQRNAKFPFTDPIVPIPCWYILAGISVLIAGITLGLLFIDSRTLRQQGRRFFGDSGVCIRHNRCLDRL